MGGEGLEDCAHAKSGEVGEKYCRKLDTQQQMRKRESVPCVAFASSKFLFLLFTGLFTFTLLTIFIDAAHCYPPRTQLLTRNEDVRRRKKRRRGVDRSDGEIFWGGVETGREWGDGKGWMRR